LVIKDDRSFDRNKSFCKNVGNKYLNPSRSQVVEANGGI